MIQVPGDIIALLHEDHCRKNIRIHFPNGERTDICNDLIVKDSVSFTESLCSQNKLKFGLCESPIFECEVVGVGNIKGATIEVYCEIECDSSVTGADYKLELDYYVYPILLGVFIVDSCKRQADMIHRKIEAYNVVASNDWKIGKIERLKYNFGGNYTPNMGYFIGSCGVPMATTVCDEDPHTWGTSSGHLIYQVDNNQTFLHVEYTAYRIKWSSATNSLYKCGFPIKTTPEKIRENFDKAARAPYLNISEQARKMAQALAVPHVRICKRTSNVQEESIVECSIGMFEYIYPYITNFYDANTANYMEYYIPVSYTSYYKNQTSTYGVKTFDYNVSSDKQYKIFTYNSDYSYMNNYNFDFSMNAITLSGNAVYRPIYPDDFNLRDKAEALTQLFGMLTYFTRDGGAKMTTLKRQFSLDPSSSLYPGVTLYPQGVTGGMLLPDDYQTCWYDDEYSKPFGAVVCQYKNTNNEDCEFTYYLSGFDEDTDESTYQVYSLENNDIIKSSIWTEAQIQEICDIIASNISGVSYMPVEFVGRGLPYVEAGDTFEILTKSNDSITTIILHRVLAGDQTLTDTYKSV